MSEESKEKIADESFPAHPPPGIGEIQAPAVGSMDLANLRRVYGDNYGTSGYGIIKAAPQPGKANFLVLDAWSNKTKLPDLNPQEVLTEGIEIVKVQYADYNSITHIFGYQNAEMSIHLGKILIKLKSVARKTGERWGEWAAKNLPFMKARTMEKFMNLARRRDCHKYAILGTERLDVLCSATKDVQDEADPIGAFMERHKVVFDPTKEFVVEEFTKQIDVALGCERVEMKGFNIPREKISTLHKLGREIDQTLIKSLTIARQSGGDPEAIVDRLIINGGKDDQLSTPQKRLADFNTSASRMLSTLDFILANQDHVDLIDRETYQMLMEKLAEIQTIRNMNSAKIEEAAE